MRRFVSLCLLAALCCLALPAIAEQAVEPQPAQAEPVLDLFDAESAGSECDAPQVAAETPEPAFLAGQQCGGVICGKGTYCCNPTCNACVLIGMSCTQQSCN